MSQKSLSPTASFGVVGVYEEVVRDIKTGEVIETFKEDNIVVDDGLDFIVTRLSTENTDSLILSSIKLGDDTGTGSVINPEMPTATYNSSNQNVIYEVPNAEISIDNPEPGALRFFATVNGATVMESFPNDPNVVYTSATLRTVSDSVFSYKRFAGRTISALVSVDISWTIKLVRV